MGAGRGRGGLQRRVQHARRAGHDHAGRAGDRRQRPRRRRHRDEQRRQRARARATGPTSPSAGRCSSSSATWAGGRPGGVDRATHGNPGKLSFCFAEDEDGSPWTSLSASRGLPAGADAVTVFAGEGPARIVDQKSRDPESLAATFAECLRAMHHPKLVMAFDALVVVGPEHARVFGEAGWDRERTVQEINQRTGAPGHRAHRGRGRHEPRACPPAFRDATLPKFRDGGLLLVHAGGRAGLFSAIIGGWVNGAIGSQPVSRLVSSVTRRGGRHDAGDPRPRRTRRRPPNGSCCPGRRRSRARWSACSTSPSPEVTSSSTGWSSASPRRRHGQALPQADLHEAGAGRPAPRDRHASARW